MRVALSGGPLAWTLFVVPWVLGWVTISRWVSQAIYDRWRPDEDFPDGPDGDHGRP